jgi:hypothetical protein
MLLKTEAIAPRLTEICRSRGISWEVDVPAGFQWIGDEEVETHAIRPALSAIEDPRFAGGVKSEFNSARNELSLGTPTALKQALFESGSAVESAMKVLLGGSSPPRPTPKPRISGVFLLAACSTSLSRVRLVVRRRR